MNSHRQDPAATLDRLKAATVFIEVSTSRGTQTGSGFLLEVDGQQGIIATNAHVVEAETGSVRQIDCVFQSGTRLEFIVRAKVVGKDTKNDLAILAVRHDDLPRPIDKFCSEKIRETMSVLVLGFPFGDVLKTSNRYPAITVTRGSISSIRLDDYDNIVVLQIDGGINPGNSGGPVVTEDGQLLGVSVAKVRGADIGLAIPQAQLADALAGNISGLSLTPVARTAQSVECRIKASLMDPKHNITSASLLAWPAATAKGKSPGDDGRWAGIADDAEEFPLELRDTAVRGTVRLPDDPAKFVYQVKWTLKDGTQRFTAPIVLDLEPTIAGRTAPPSRPRNGVPRPGLSTLPDDAQILLFPTAMSDFAINPNTGDVAMLDPTGGRALLVRDDAAAGDESIETRVGPTPVAVTYKRFGEQEVFAVVCSQDSHMYVLDAADLSVVRKIPLVSAGVSSVTSSRNPEDPFLYYNYGSGHGSAAGAVDLREMVDRGLAIDDSMDCAISADGQIAYRRGPWSPSGFESLTLNSEFSAEKPSFTKLFYDHRSTGAYVPDPAGAFTASGRTIYSRELDRQVASLDFSPSAFLTSRPLVVGLDGLNIKAASYNTLARVGRTLKLPEEFGGQALSLPRGVRSQADFKRVGLRQRLIADDRNDRLIYAFRDKLARIPLAALDVTDEPFMDVDVDVTEIRTGSRSAIAVTPRSPQVTVEYGNLPDGMTATDSGLEWEPRREQIGTFTIPVTLSFKDIQRVVDLQIRVSPPFREAPFDIAGLTVNEAGKEVLCWSYTGRDDRGVPLRARPDAEPPDSRLAAVPLNGEGEVRQQQLAYGVRDAIICGSHVVLLSSADDTRAEVYDLRRLNRTKTLLLPEPIQRVTRVGDELLLHGKRSIVVHSTATFKRLRSLNTGGRREALGTSSADFHDGTLVDGILYSSVDNKPVLLVDPWRYPALRGADHRLFGGSFLRSKTKTLLSPADSRQRDARNASGTTTVAGSVEIPQHRLRAELKRTVKRDAGRSRSLQAHVDVSLSVTDERGIPLYQVPFIKGDFPIAHVNSAMHPRMDVHGETVVIAVGRRIYEWSPDGPDDGAAGGSDEDDDVEFHVVPVQSAFGVPEGRAELKHTLNGGKGPFEYFLMTQLDGVLMDEATGVVTVDTEKLLPEVAALLTRTYPQKSTDTGSAVEKLQTQMIDALEPASKLLKRRPRGVLFAVPVHFKVTDNDGAVAEMQYFVLMDVSWQSVASMLDKP